MASGPNKRMSRETHKKDRGPADADGASSILMSHLPPERHPDSDKLSAARYTLPTE